MNENKILAAILTIATSARESRGSSAEAGNGYERILAELDRDLGRKAG